MARISRGGVAQLDHDKPKSRCRRWMLSCRVDGRRRMRRFSGTYREACAELDEWRAQVAAEEPDGETVLDFAERWARYREESGAVAHNTVLSDAYAVRSIAASPLASVPLAKASPQDVREALLWMRDHAERGERLSDTTLVTLRTKLGVIFNAAIADGLIASSPMRGVKAPKPDTEEREALTPAQIGEVLSRIEASEELDGVLVGVAVMLVLGLRIGEAMGVEMRDLGDGVLHVRGRLDERAEKQATKTPAGVRSLPVPRRLADLLARWRSERLEAGIGDAPTLCCLPDGRPMRPATFRWHWVRRRDALGCAGMVPHQLRHSNLSMIARYMPSAFDLQKWAGWKSLEPAKIYIHADADVLRGAAECAFGCKSVTPALMGGDSEASTSSIRLL